jgi:hypothetical protein
MKHGKRVSVAFTALVLSMAVGMLAVPALAGACEEATVTIPAVARGYVYGSSLRFVDGLVTNDSSVTVKVDKVRVSWAEAPGATSDFWVGDQFLAPGQWTTFHDSWPCGIEPTWTVDSATAYAYKQTGTSGAIALKLRGVSSSPVMDGDMRVWTVSVTNTSSVTVSSVELIGREMDGGTFVDTLFSWDLPDQIAAGESVYFQVRGKSPWPVEPTAEMRFTAREKPTITLTPDTLSPVYGTPVTFRIELRRSDGSLATGSRTLKIYHSYDGKEWEDGYFHENTNTGFVVTQITPDRPTYYRAVYWGGDDLGQAIGEWMLVTPQLANGAPIAPRHIHARRPFVVTGRIGAGIQCTGNRVTVYAEKKSGRRWVRKVKLAATADANGAYRKSLKLTSRGTWRVRAYRPGVGYSKYRTVTVR